MNLFDECYIRGQRFAPARFCAPLAGYTHSAFRRLLMELGGCGAWWTEMLAAKQIIGEDFAASPWVKTQPGEGPVFFQLMARSGDPFERILNKMGEHGVKAVDLNLACDAIAIKSCEAGSGLYQNFDSMRSVVEQARKYWPGILTAKIRLGSERGDWQKAFVERVRFLEENGIDALTIHPRFFEDKFRRRARLELIPWVASLTRLPLVANGDLTGPEQVRQNAEHLSPACAIMIGRMAISQPWIFATWTGQSTPDHAGVWRKMHQYIQEDFPPEVALRRLRMFTKYFAANFAFGHSLNVQVGNAPTMEQAMICACEFFQRNPNRLARPVVAGL